jgi:GMP synthase-like glutamine amidotransferase
MSLAILETGKPPLPLLERFGRYPAMFERLLDREAASYDVEAGELPARPDAHTAYLVTGSPAGVYDELPWIAPLLDFLRSAKGKAKLVGVCFGHQAMAQAFGGHVEKSHRGWGVGLCDYRIVERLPFMDGEDTLAVPISHQDQIVRQPPHSRVLAGNAFSPFGMLAYEDQPALSCQFHPEFSPDFAAALIDLRRERLNDPDKAIGSLSAPNDNERVGRWIGAFLDG